jgi:Cof subfamily protein (haloacid dehalogenase superfamily)
LRYRLIAADLDGTLRPERQSFTPRVRQAVRQAQERGVHVVMATGRMYRTAQPFALDLGLQDPIICDHGATIRDPSTGETLMQLRMPVDLARQVIENAAPDLTLVACVDEEFYISRLTEHAVAFVGSYAGDHLHQVGDLSRFLDRGPQKLVFVNEPEVSSRLLVDLTARFGALLQVVQSFPRYVELTHREVSKGKAVEWLASGWGIPREEVIAIGDQGNDCSMIEWAGLGVAMGNAIDGVKAIANYVAPSAEEDGVADVIDRYVLSE